MIEQSPQILNNSSHDTDQIDNIKMIKKTSNINKRNSQTLNVLEVNKQNSSQSSSSQSSGKLPCINKICPKVKNLNLKAYQNKHHAFNPEDLCQQCLTQYKKQAFCLYCKQIYFDSSDDGKQWILCDDCGRWVHSQCANYDPSIDSDFKCIKCKKHSHTQNQNLLVKKISTKPNSKNPDRRKQLAQCSLNAYGFYWQLAPKQLADDMDKIREFLH